MNIRIKVPHSDNYKYESFCYLFLHEVKKDLIRRLNPKKLEARKSKIDKLLSVNLNYYKIYELVINTLYLAKDSYGGYYNICFNESLYVSNIKIYHIFKIIEYGVIGVVEPYPFIRSSIVKYNELLKELYDTYCRRGIIDLSI